MSSGHDALAAVLGVAADALAGAGFAFDDGVDDLEVRRIGGEANLNGLARLLVVSSDS